MNPRFNILVLTAITLAILGFNMYANHIHNDSMVSHSWLLINMIVGGILAIMRSEPAPPYR